MNNARACCCYDEFRLQAGWEDNYRLLTDAADGEYFAIAECHEDGIPTPTADRIASRLEIQVVRRRPTVGARLINPTMTFSIIVGQVRSLVRVGPSEGAAAGEQAPVSQKRLSAAKAIRRWRDAVGHHLDRIAQATYHPVKTTVGDFLHPMPPPRGSQSP